MIQSFFLEYLLTHYGDTGTTKTLLALSIDSYTAIYFLFNYFSFHIRLYQLSKQGKLTVAAMNVNDSVTKVSFFHFVSFSKYFSFRHNKSINHGAVISFCRQSLTTCIAVENQS